jgi:hypothetical protein
MKEKRPYETLDVRVVEFHRADDVITSSIIDNYGDFRDWESEGDTW